MSYVMFEMFCNKLVSSCEDTHIIMNKSVVRKQVEESNYEAKRKKRIIVLNIQEKEDKTDREQVKDMIGDMGVRVGEEEVVDVVRMRKKEGVGLARLIIYC